MRRMYSENQIAEIVKKYPQAVVKALEGQDINVEGITSKGIANTGNIANIGDIATTGKISGGEIVELMSGYSFVAPSQTEELSLIYASAVKNGNKLTLVVFGSYTRRTEDPKVNPTLGEFVIPGEVASKIIPWSSVFVDSKNIPVFSSASTIVEKAVGVEKRDSTHISFTGYGFHSLTAETQFMFRIEETFLLSENMIPSGE